LGGYPLMQCHANSNEPKGFLQAENLSLVQPKQICKGKILHHECLPSMHCLF